MSGVLLGIVIAGIIICLLFLLLLYVRQPRTSVKFKSDNFSVEALTYSPFLKKIIDVVLPKQGEKEFVECSRLISDSGVKISMRGVYFFKIVVPVVLLISLLSIYFINRSVYIDAIVTDQLVEEVNMIGSTDKKSEAEHENDSERKKAAKDTYEVITNLIDTRFLKNKDAVVAKQEIQEAVVKSKIETEEDITTIVNNYYNKRIQVEDASKINPVTIFILILVSLCGFMIPNFFLKLSKFIRYQAFDNEVIALEMLTILVGSIENITVKEILKILSQNSKVFKKDFEKAILEYPTDFELALIHLEESSKNKDFQALVSTLRQCATSDKYAALQTLQRRRISRKEYRKLTEEKKIETKMYVGLIVLLPVLFFVAKLLLSPWQDLMYSSGIL